MSNSIHNGGPSPTGDMPSFKVRSNEGINVKKARHKSLEPSSRIAKTSGVANTSIGRITPSRNPRTIGDHHRVGSQVETSTSSKTDHIGSAKLPKSKAKEESSPPTETVMQHLKDEKLAVRLNKLIDAQSLDGSQTERVSTGTEKMTTEEKRSKMLKSSSTPLITKKKIQAPQKSSSEPATPISRAKKSPRIIDKEKTKALKKEMRQTIKAHRNKIIATFETLKAKSVSFKLEGGKIVSTKSKPKFEEQAIAAVKLFSDLKAALNLGIYSIPDDQGEAVELYELLKNLGGRTWLSSLLKQDPLLQDSYNKILMRLRLGQSSDTVTGLSKLLDQAQISFKSLSQSLGKDYAVKIEGDILIPIEALFLNDADTSYLMIARAISKNHQQFLEMDGQELRSIIPELDSHIIQQIQAPLKRPVIHTYEVFSGAIDNLTERLVTLGAMTPKARDAIKAKFKKSWPTGDLAMGKKVDYNLALLQLQKLTRKVQENKVLMRLTQRMENVLNRVNDQLEDFSESEKKTQNFSGHFQSVFEEAFMKDGKLKEEISKEIANITSEERQKLVEYFSKTIPGFENEMKVEGSFSEFINKLKV